MIIITTRGIISVRGGAEAAAAMGTVMRQIGDDIANLANGVDDAKDLIELAQAAMSDNGLNTTKVIGAVAMSTVAAAAVIAAAGAAPVAGAVAVSVAVGIGAGYIYERLFDAAIGIGQRAGEAAYDLFGDKPPNSSVNDWWNNAKNPPRRDPLAIDLDGDGIETIGLPTAANPFNPVLFDHNADGVRTGTGWVRPDDAWLALDRNGNGTIDSGRELFGVDTQVQVTETIPQGGQMVTNTYTRNAFNGFEALSTLDSNGDKVFNSADAQFANVRLWQDTNQDGISQASELKTLAQQGITAINLTPDNSNINLGNGNTVTGQAAVTRTNGSTTTVGGVGISTQASNLNLADNPFYRQFNDTIPLTAAAKALPGMGGSGWVRDLREAMSLSNPAAPALQSKVSAFAVAGATPNAQMAQVDALLAEWAKTTGRMTTRTSVQGVEGVAQELDRTVVSSVNGVVTARFTATDPANYRNPDTGVIDVAQLRLPLTTQYYTITNSIDTAGKPIKIYTLNAEGTQVYNRLAILEVFNGSRFADITTTEVVGNGGGTGAAQTKGYRVAVVMSIAQDQIDFLNQAYDALRESTHYAMVVQTRLKPYLDAVDLVIDAQGVSFNTTALNTLLEAKKGADLRNALTDLLELNKYAQGTLQAVGFDGTGKLRAWVDALPTSSPLRTELKTLGLLLGGDGSQGSEGNDVYLGNAANNTFNAGDGDDALDGGDANDDLRGDDGNDTLMGNTGNDRLDGGAGNDSMTGGAGNDVYVVDAATDATVEAAAGGTDTVESSISWTLGTEVENLTLTGTTTINGTGNTLANVITGNSGANTLSGGVGNDTLVGNAGDDRLDGGAGNDSMTGGVGNDVYVVDSATDLTIEAAAGGTDTVEASLSWTLAAQVENLTLTGTTSINGTGNTLANVITGNGGANSLSGGEGNDTLVGNAGDDTLIGGKGDDVYHVNGSEGFDFAYGPPGPPRDVVVELANEGDDTLITTNYSETLFANVENLVASSNLALHYVPSGVKIPHVYTGNDLNNRIDVTLVKGLSKVGGGAGADTVYGSSDHINTYVVDNAGDVIVEVGTGNGLGDTVESSVNYTLGNGLENLTLTGSSATTGTGNASDNVLDGRLNASANTLTGLGGNDTYIIGLNDTVAETANGGNDTVLLTQQPSSASIPFKLSNWSHIENLALDVNLGAVNLQGDAGNNKLTGSLDANVIEGGDGDDVIVGVDPTKVPKNPFSSNDDVIDVWAVDQLNGGKGNDVIHSVGANDLVNGGEGNDAIHIHSRYAFQQIDGGSGNDSIRSARSSSWVDPKLTIQFGVGAGNDTVAGAGFTGTGGNIQVAAGTDASRLRVSRSGSSLVVSLTGASDSLTIQDFYENTTSDAVRSGVDAIRLNEETILTRTALVAAVKDADMAMTSNGDDVQVVSASNTSLVGGLGNDHLFGNSTADRLDGGAGNDSLSGGDGADTLVGGIGNDTLVGGRGADVYRFDLGWGQDKIVDILNAQQRDDTSVDTVVFAAGIKASDIAVSQVNAYDLQLTHKVSGDRLVINQFFWPASTSPRGSVELIKFEDGNVTWDSSTLSSGNKAPSLVHPLQDNTINLGNALNISVREDAFNDADSGDQLTYAATLSNGQALPSWLSFNPSTRNFSGTPPASALGSDKSLANWVSQARCGQLGAVDSRRVTPVTDSQAEISRLKRELAQAREERDILKKAAAYFASVSR
jgi:Ca2+-binding RTX toxin-like protein